MRAKIARSIARQWLAREVVSRPGFRGALWHGSVLGLPDDAHLDAATDLDLIVIFDESPQDLRRGKIPVDGALLDVTVLSWSDVCNPDIVLANHQLAPSFRSPALLADPNGELERLRDAVGREFSRREWVERRVDRAVGKIGAFLEGVNPGAPFAGSAMSWLFGAGVTTHLLLVAGLRNPTVRRRYIAARDLLGDTGMLDVHVELLQMLGSASLFADQASHHLDALEPAFDAAVSAIRTPVAFPGSDLSRAACPIAIGGSRAMIAAGDHREAMFWIAATWIRCMQVFHADDPALETRFDGDFHGMLADLGIRAVEDMQARAAEVRAALPYLRSIADTIMASTPEITD